MFGKRIHELLQETWKTSSRHISFKWTNILYSYSLYLRIESCFVYDNFLFLQRKASCSQEYYAIVMVTKYWNIEETTKGLLLISGLRLMVIWLEHIYFVWPLASKNKTLAKWNGKLQEIGCCLFRTKQYFSFG